MFVSHDDCPLEDLGGGVRRRILAHAGGLMQVEVLFDEHGIVHISCQTSRYALPRILSAIWAWWINCFDQPLMPV